MDYLFETERLRLRLMTTDDVDNLRPILASEKAMKYYPETLNDDKIRAWIEKTHKRYEKHGHALWMVELKETGEAIGQCGILRWTIEGQEENEIGYLFNPAFWGNGYATEAARGCMEYGKKRWGYSRFISLIDEKNQPSINVALRNGLSLEKTISFQWVEKTNIYSIVI